MQEVKIHHLTLTPLVISTYLMTWYAVENFSAGQNAYGMVFILISVFMAGLVIYGIIRNRSINENEKSGI